MATDWTHELDRVVDRLYDDVVAIRRKLHSQPELSGEEFQTSLYLYQRLGDLGLEVTMGPEGRGVYADSSPGRRAPRIAIRADIDALRIQDRKKTSYRSRVDGVMHACGHDAHSALVFGAAAALRAMDRDRLLPWEVHWRAIFQPAEETAAGAVEMIHAGAIEQIDAVVAAHVDPTRATGEIGLKRGVLTANCDMVRMVVRGRGGHAARPHESNDPIAAAAMLINSIYQFVPRATDSQDAVVVTFGQVTGGENANVIPERVNLRGTLRTLDRVTRQRAMDQITQISRGVEAISQTRIDIDFESSIPSVDNDPRLVAVLDEAVRLLPGDVTAAQIERPSMGSEDFACYLEHLPGAMIRLGSTRDPDHAPRLHTPLFDVDERCLAVGAKILAAAVIKWAEPEAAQTSFEI